jgi:hypothetical protein
MNDAVWLHDRPLSGLTYILADDGRTAIPAPSYLAAEYCLRNIGMRRVGRDTLTFRGVSVEVSTVFTVHNYNFINDGGAPILWETMTFSQHKAALDGWQYRYTSYEDASFGHECVVALMRHELRRHPVSVRRARVARRKRGVA